MRLSLTLWLLIAAQTPAIFAGDPEEGSVIIINPAFSLSKTRSRSETPSPVPPPSTPYRDDTPPPTISPTH